MAKSVQLQIDLVNSNEIYEEVGDQFTADITVLVVRDDEEVKYTKHETNP